MDPVIFFQDNWQLLVNGIAVCAFFYRAGTREVAHNQKLRKVNDSLDEKIQQVNLELIDRLNELKVELAEVQTQRKGDKQFFNSQLTIARKSVTEGQERDERRIQKLHDVIKSIENTLASNNMPVIVPRETLY